MTFIASKLLWMLVAPGNLILFALVLGTLQLSFSKGRRGLGMVALATMALIFCAVLPLGDWLAAPLENRFPLPREMPEQVDGVLLLGGAVDAVLSVERGQVALNEAAERVTETVVLARRYPGAKIVISGGDALLLPSGVTEASATRDLLLALGVSGERLVIEDASRNTWENAAFSYAAARPGLGETWLLVTSAMHMPRAVGCFRHAGWSVQPYPVDYRTPPVVPFRVGVGFPAGIEIVNLVVREWLGLAAYRLLGRTDALFPAP
jgi:uncharacterized SAM-binding protein YcdF (DUF218 family)